MSSRRNLLKIGLSAPITCAVLPTFAVPVNAPNKYDEEFDLIVVGAGNAGLSAAAHGSSSGLKVLVLEKMAIIGGSSAICGGSWAASNTAMQKKQGIKDSAELFEKDMLNTGRHMNDPQLVARYVKETNKEYDFLISHGVKPRDVHAAGGMSVPRVHAFDPAAVH